MDAPASYDRAVEIDPRYANAHMGRGNVLWHLGRPAEALKSYRRASESSLQIAGPPYQACQTKFATA